MTESARSTRLAKRRAIARKRWTTAIVVSVLTLGAAGYAWAAGSVTRLYACVNSSNLLQRTAATSTTVCKPGWVRVSWGVTEDTPSPTTTTQAPTTTQPATTTTSPATTTTTQPPTTTTTVGGTCTGVALTGGQTQVAAAATGTTFCLSGTHNWSLTPKAGQKFIGPAILDGGGITAHAFTATAPNVVLQNLTIRNYRPSSAQDAVIHVDDSDSVKQAASGWQLRSLDVGPNTNTGSGSGNGWTFTGGRYHDNNVGGIMGSMGNSVTLDGVEIDHNNFTSSAYTTRNHSCGDEAGGIKWVTNDLTIKNSFVHHNACKGIWADLSAERALILNNRVYDNWDEGIFFEISSTATITGNDVQRNGLKNYNHSSSGCSFGWGGGITSSNSGRTAAAGNGTVDIGSNSLVGNCNGITVVDISGRDEGPCPCDAANTLVHDNVISGGGPTGAWTDRGTNLANQNIVFTRNTFLNGATFCGLDC